MIKLTLKHYNVALLVFDGLWPQIFLAPTGAHRLGLALRQQGQERGHAAAEWPRQLRRIDSRNVQTELESNHCTGGPAHDCHRCYQR